MGEVPQERQTSPSASSAATWTARPVAAQALSVATVVVPAVLSIAFAVLVELVVPQPSGTLARVLWWIGILGLSAVVLAASGRLARRARPLAVLLGLGLVFPGPAPNRLEIAKRASGRDLRRRFVEARFAADVDDQLIAATRIVTLAVAMNAYDRRTRGHGERVRALTDLIAIGLGLQAEDRDRLRWAALLHDMGKLGVPEGVLNTQGSLPPIERDLMRRHPVEGAELAAPLADWLGDWASTIAEHHERYDGTGYPFGLIGEEISLGGRILAVADAYDAMTSSRSYKGVVSADAARAEIARCGGVQFDPVVVRAFLALPVRRNRTTSPSAWLGMLPVGFDGLELTAFGRAAASLVVVGAILGLTAWGPWAPHSGADALAAAPASRSAATGGQPAASAQGLGGPATTSAAASAGVRASQLVDARGGASRSASSAKSGRSGDGSSGPGRGSKSGRSPASREASRGSTPGGHGSSPGSGDPPSPSTDPGSTSGSTPSGTTPPGSTPTTGPPGSTPTTQKSPPTTSHRSPPPPTTTTLPPPSPATGVSAAASCRNVLIGPQVYVQWTDSVSSWVTSYVIMRSSDGTDYSPIATVSAGASSYTDSSVAGLGTTYWYEIVARSGEGSATSGSVSVTTPLTCLT